MRTQLLIGIIVFLAGAPMQAANPLSYVGEQHNVQVQYVLENIESVPAPEDTNAVVAGILCEYLSITEGGCVWPPFPQYPWPWPNPGGPWDLPGLDLYETIRGFGLSADLEFYSFQTLNLLDQQLPLGDFEEALTNLEAEAETVLNEEDLSIYYGFSAVARHSLRFWLSEDDGGMGGLQFVNAGTGVNVEEVSASINWWKVGAVDAVGAIAGGIMGGPKGAIVVGAASSVISIIMQW